MTEAEVFVQGCVAALYLFAAMLMLGSLGARDRLDRLAVAIALVGVILHVILFGVRWNEIGQVPIVTRYEDMTVDSLLIAVIYLFARWHLPQLRPAGAFVFFLAAIGVAFALAYSRSHLPMGPSLRTNWLIIHAQLNSFALGVGTLAAGVQLAWVFGKASGADIEALAGRILAWAFFLWAAMVAAGSYWASLAWGRYWGWDPIESWSLATVLAYAFVLHLRQKRAWRGKRGAVVALLPYFMMVFTTYGLLLVRGSVHAKYLFR